MTSTPTLRCWRWLITPSFSTCDVAIGVWNSFRIRSNWS